MFTISQLLKFLWFSLRLPDKTIYKADCHAELLSHIFVHFERLIAGRQYPFYLPSVQVLAMSLFVVGADGLLQAALLLQVSLRPTFDVVRRLRALQSMMCTGSFLVHLDWSLMNYFSWLIPLDFLGLLCDGLSDFDGSQCP